MATVRLQVKNIINLGLWDKVCEFKGWNPWILNEGRITEDEWVEFDDTFDNTEWRYPEYVYDAVCSRLEVSQDEVEELDQGDVFAALVAWKLGHSEWSSTIQEWIKDVYKIELPR